MAEHVVKVHPPRQESVTLSGRRSGRTTLALREVLEAVRAGERVSFVVHEQRMVPYCHGILRDYLGANTVEVRQIQFVSVTSLDRVRGRRGRVFWDHTARADSVHGALAGEGSKVHEEIEHRRTCWVRLLGDPSI